MSIYNKILEETSLRPPVDRSYFPSTSEGRKREPVRTGRKIRFPYLIERIESKSGTVTIKLYKIGQHSERLLAEDSGMSRTEADRLTNVILGIIEEGEFDNREEG